MVIHRLFGLTALLFLLQGCSSVSQPTFMKGADESTPYGDWLLLNAKDMQDNLVSGTLSVCQKSSGERSGLPCSKNSYVFTVLEKNFGYGCNDFASTGDVEFNRDKQQWFLVSEGCSQAPAERMRVERHGQQLFVFQGDGTKLVFERSTRKEIDNKASQACELSYRQEGF